MSIDNRKSAIKPKPPRPKTCKQCKNRFQPERQFQETCCIKCALELAKSKREKKAVKDEANVKRKERAKEREARKKTKEYKDNDYSHQHDLTKSAIQKWVNHVRDAGLPCISCSTTNNVVYCGSHYRTAGGNSEISLDTRNIHRACNVYCNKNLSGNISGTKTTHGYTVGLINRYGQEYVDWLNGYHAPVKYTCDQLRDIRAYYAKLTRDKNTDDSDCPHVERFQNV